MRLSRALLVITLSTVATACTRVSGLPPRPAGPDDRGAPARPPAPGVAGEYTGRVWMAGGEFAVVITVDPSAGSEVDAALTIAELGLHASGGGTVTPDRIVLRFRYGGECDGSITIDAHMEDQGARGDGTLEAGDCTGRESGPLALTRRPKVAGAPPGASR